MWFGGSLWAEWVINLPVFVSVLYGMEPSLVAYDTWECSWGIDLQVAARFASLYAVGMPVDGEVFRSSCSLVRLGFFVETDVLARHARSRRLAECVLCLEF
ncbi:hypothetical protein M758_12G013200 [Ceratodon purpureus]|nr:hypothetical protein M758_12G013200 [Ceratodon purpureus]